MSSWLEVILPWKRNELLRWFFCGKALWNFCYKFTFVADATSVTLSFCMTVVLGIKPVLVSSSITISEEYESDSLLYDTSAIRACVHIDQAIGTNWRQSYLGGVNPYKPSVRYITFFWLLVGHYIRYKRGPLSEVKVGDKLQYLVLLWMFAITLYDSTVILNYHPRCLSLVD